MPQCLKSFSLVPRVQSSGAKMPPRVFIGERLAATHRAPTIVRAEPLNEGAPRGSHRYRKATATPSELRALADAAVCRRGSAMVGATIEVVRGAVGEVALWGGYSAE